MIFNQPLDSLELGWFMANALSNARAAVGQATIDALLASETQLQVRSAVQQGGLTTLPVYWANSGTYTLILIGPTQGLVMATQLMEGYHFGAALGSPLGIENSWVHDQNTAIRTWAQANGMTFTRNTYIGGYSAGGMIAASIYKWIIDRQPDVTPNMISFGSPRFCGQQIAREIGDGNVVRWMNDIDPVPLIPPRLSNGPAWAATVALNVMSGWGRYTHIAGGISLNEAGQGQARETPQGASLAPTLSLATWLMGQVTGEQGQHSITEYMRRLNAPIGGDFDGTHEVPRARLIEPLPDQDRRQINEAGRQVVNQVFAQGAQQNAVAAVIPDPQRPRVVRQGRIWSVYWGETFIAMGPTKKRALKMKNALLTLLFSFQHQAVTEPDAFVRHAQQYFDLAVQEGNGFVPAVQDEFPED